MARMIEKILIERHAELSAMLNFAGSPSVLHTGAFKGEEEKLTPASAAQGSNPLRQLRPFGQGPLQRPHFRLRTPAGAPRLLLEDAPTRC